MEIRDQVLSGRHEKPHLRVCCRVKVRRIHRRRATASGLRRVPPASDVLELLGSELEDIHDIYVGLIS